jgi:hypothetical protein
MSIIFNNNIHKRELQEKQNSQHYDAKRSNVRVFKYLQFFFNRAA